MQTSTPNIAFLVQPHPIMQINMSIGRRLPEKPKLPIPIDPMGNISASNTGHRDDTSLVLEAFKKQKLTKVWMNRHCGKRWKVAVITHAEDKRVSEVGRSTLFKTPEARWAAANIEF
jgi:hypothetical protein